MVGMTSIEKNQRFGLWLAGYPSHESGRWMCRCLGCGVLVSVVLHNLLRGTTRRCQNCARAGCTTVDPDIQAILDLQETS